MGGDGDGGDGDGDGGIGAAAAAGLGTGDSGTSGNIGIGGDPGGIGAGIGGLGGLGGPGAGDTGGNVSGGFSGDYGGVSGDYGGGIGAGIGGLGGLGGPGAGDYGGVSSGFGDYGGFTGGFSTFGEPGSLAAQADAQAGINAFGFSGLTAMGFNFADISSPTAAELGEFGEFGEFGFGFTGKGPTGKGPTGKGPTAAQVAAAQQGFFGKSAPFGIAIPAKGPPGVQVAELDEPTVAKETREEPQLTVPKDAPITTETLQEQPHEPTQFTVVISPHTNPVDAVVTGKVSGVGTSHGLSSVNAPAAPAVGPDANVSAPALGITTNAWGDAVPTAITGPAINGPVNAVPGFPAEIGVTPTQSMPDIGVTSTPAQLSTGTYGGLTFGTSVFGSEADTASQLGTPNIPQSHINAGFGTLDATNVPTSGVHGPFNDAVGIPTSRGEAMENEALQALKAFTPKGMPFNKATPIGPQSSVSDQVGNALSALFGISTAQAAPVSKGKGKSATTAEPTAEQDQAAMAKAIAKAIALGIMNPDGTPGPNAVTFSQPANTAIPGKGEAQLVNGHIGFPSTPGPSMATPAQAQANLATALAQQQATAVTNAISAPTGYGYGVQGGFGFPAQAAGPAPAAPANSLGFGLGGYGGYGGHSAVPGEGQPGGTAVGSQGGGLGGGTGGIGAGQSAISGPNVIGIDDIFGIPPSALVGYPQAKGPPVPSPQPNPLPVAVPTPQPSPVPYGSPTVTDPSDLGQPALGKGNNLGVNPNPPGSITNPTVVTPVPITPTEPTPTPTPLSKEQQEQVAKAKADLAKDLKERAERAEQFQKNKDALDKAEKERAERAEKAKAEPKEEPPKEKEKPLERPPPIIKDLPLTKEVIKDLETKIEKQEKAKPQPPPVVVPLPQPRPDVPVVQPQPPPIAVPLPQPRPDVPVVPPPAPVVAPPPAVVAAPPPAPVVAPPPAVVAAPPAAPPGTLGTGITGFTPGGNINDWINQDQGRRIAIATSTPVTAVTAMQTLSQIPANPLGMTSAQMQQWWAQQVA